MIKNNDIGDSHKPDLRTDKRKTGDKGEEIACMFLVKQGFKIQTRNYLRKYGEIDIVATRGVVTHFIEVKTVTREIKDNVIHETSSDAYKAEDNIHPWKLLRLSRVIQAYILDKRLFDREWQFDVITVALDPKGDKAAIEYLENIIL